MATYHVKYYELQNQAVSLQNMGKTLASFENRLNTIAKVMDGRDTSMAVLKLQVMLYSRAVPALAARMSTGGTVVAEAASMYLSAEKSVHGAVVGVNALPINGAICVLKVAASSTGTCTGPLNTGSIDKAEDEAGLVNDIIDLITNMFLGDPVIGKLPLISEIMDIFISALRITDEMTTGIACGQSLGVTYGKIISETVYMGFKVAATTVFGASGASTGALIGTAVFPGVGTVVGAAIGGLGSAKLAAFVTDYVFLDQAKAAFGIIKVDGLGVKAEMADAIAKLVDAQDRGKPQANGYGVDILGSVYNTGTVFA